MGKIAVVGIGPGSFDAMTLEARRALNESDIIVGYKAYTALIRVFYPDKTIVDGEMTRERERCEACIAYAKEGKNVALICSGDAGVYGMASPMLEVAAKEGFTDVMIVPGVTAALSGAAVLGAPLSTDFCVISLSDILTPWEVIEKRLLAAADGDFPIALYNPASHRRAGHLKRACEILLRKLPGDRCCGFVRNIGREGTSVELCSLQELQEKTVDMFVTVFIGSSRTYREGDRLITPRGYEIQ
ncbi:MAG: precorrin-3B C(17)-methyltransferase [Lachnospiraceae bacterium]|nr:precorrin-3B C(17)-methyltransferase [Lachnospiraceae bacterium]